MTESAKTIPSIIPSILRDYQCSQCGGCCYGWNIEIFPLELKEIMSSLRTIPKEERPVNYGFEVKRDEQNKIKNLYFRLFENHCGFLQEDQKCFLHARFGSQIKPSVCTSYPLYAIRTPKAIYVSLSFSCMAACRMLLSNGKFSNASFSTKYSGNELSLKTDANETKFVYLTKDCTIGWDGFYFLQHHFVAQREEEIFDFIDTFWSKLKTLKQNHLTLKQLQKLIASEPAEKKSISDPFAHLRLMMDLIGMLFEYDSNAYLLFPVLHFFNRLGIDYGQITLESAERYRLDAAKQGIWKTPELRQILSNYARTRLFINEHYFTRNILEALFLLSASIGMIVFLTSVSIATEKGISPAHILDAVFTLEKHFLHSTILDQLPAEDISPSIAMNR